MKNHRNTGDLLYYIHYTPTSGDHSSWQILNMGSHSSWKVVEHQWLSLPQNHHYNEYIWQPHTGIPGVTGYNTTAATIESEEQ